VIVQLLAVDDDKTMLEMVKAAFVHERGYRVDTTTSGREGLKRAAAGDADLIILDWNLPDLSGFEICQILRRDVNTAGLPILMLTAEARMNKKVDAIEKGADDYLVKPFHVDELKVRVKAILRRRAPWLVQSQPLEFGDLRLDPSSLKASVGGKDAGLTPMEFNILYALAANAGRIVQRRFLELRILGKEEFSRALDVHLSHVREKLGARHAKRIETAKGLGYLFSGD
jgi:DNA-binding response OmpR family regulator